jgi:hypothetical protein
MGYEQFSKANIVWRPELLTACCHLHITVSKEEDKSYYKISHSFQSSTSHKYHRREERGEVRVWGYQQEECHLVMREGQPAVPGQNWSSLGSKALALMCRSCQHAPHQQQPAGCSNMILKQIKLTSRVASTCANAIGQSAAKIEESCRNLNLTVMCSV